MVEDISVQRCLVTGASGFVGRVLCQQLQSENIHVKALSRHTTSGPWNECIQGDLLSLDACLPELFQQVDTVFYLASVAHNKAPASDYKKINVDACLAFARHAIECGVKNFVYVSSTKAMASPGEKCVDESFSDKPSDPYSLSKRQAEEGLLAMKGFEHLVIVRPCLVYGEHMQGNLYALLKQIDTGYFPALPKTSARRSMVSAWDLSKALMAASSQAKAHRQVYIVADDEAYAVSDLEKSIRKSLGKKRPMVVLPNALLLLAGQTGDKLSKMLPGFPLTSEAVKKLTGSAMYSADKIKRELNWKPTQSFYDLLPKIIQAYRESL